MLLQLINNSSSQDKGNPNCYSGLDTWSQLADFDDLLIFCFDWKDISNTRDSVSSAIQTPQISSKILRCASYFQLFSRCLDIPMEHCLSCLIYYVIDLLSYAPREQWRLNRPLPSNLWTGPFFYRSSALSVCFLAASVGLLSSWFWRQPVRLFITWATVFASQLDRRYRCCWN